MPLKSRFPQIAAQLRPRTLAGIDAGGELVEQRAKQRVPVGAPDVHLRDAIHTVKGGGGVFVVAGDSEVFYGHMVEHGTSRSAPHPFLVPALEESRDEIVALVSASLRGL